MILDGKQDFNATKQVYLSTGMNPKHETEVALRESEERLRLALESAELGAWDCDLQSNEVSGDERAQEIFGIPIKRMPLSQFLLVVHPDDRDKVNTVAQEVHRSLAPTRHRVEFRAVRPDGEIRWIALHGKAHFEGNGANRRAVRCIGTVMDISEQKLAEEELARDLEAMTKLQEVGSFFVREADLEPALVQIVDAAIAISRADFGNIQLCDPKSDLKIRAQRGFPEWYVDFWNEVTAGHGSCGSALAAGQRVIVPDVEQSPLFAGTQGLEMQRKAGVRAVQSTPVVSRSGKVLGMFSTHFKRPHAPDEHALKLLDLLARQAADIIERAQIAQALRAAKEDLTRVNQDLEDKVRERTAKLKEMVAELEGFSYSLVHDLRAPLRAMVGYSAILQSDAAERLRPEENGLLHRIGLASKRMDQLVTDSLNYGKLLHQELPLRPVDIGALLHGLVETYPNLNPPQADVAIEIGHLMVYGNEAALIQIFSNLLGNAVKFVAPGIMPQVRVRASTEHCPHDFSKHAHACTFVCVEDNGIGIPKYAHEQIFAMFQRLHRSEEYPGTGIGLALVKKCLERTGGKITLESEPGKGSRFCVQLPLADKSGVHPV